MFCDTPREVAEKADCIFLCVGNTEMAKEVILGEERHHRGHPRRERWSRTPAPSAPTKAGRSGRR